MHQAQISLLLGFSSKKFLFYNGENGGLEQMSELS